MTWRGRSLQKLLPSGGEWAFRQSYEERLAAKWWGVTPDVWRDKALDVRAEMLAVYRIEMGRQIVERDEAERKAEKLRKRH